MHCKNISKVQPFGKSLASHVSQEQEQQEHDTLQFASSFHFNCVFVFNTRHFQEILGWNHGDMQMNFQLCGLE